MFSFRRVAMVMPLHNNGSPSKDRQEVMLHCTTALTKVNDTGNKNQRDVIIAQEHCHLPNSGNQNGK